MRFEDSGISEMVGSNLSPDRTVPDYLLPHGGLAANGEGIETAKQAPEEALADIFADDAVKYETLLGKLDAVLEKLGLDA